jgi:creatinine amidohydrolase
VLGDAEKASAAKGRVAYEEAVKQLARFITWFQARPKDRRRMLHRKKPTMPLPWGQQPISK